jgi:hypothetical protein
VPAPQAEQERSLLAVPAVETYVPAAQVDQGSQLVWLLLSVKVPLLQAVQERLLVAVPAVET